MKAERWQQVDRLFQAALEREPEKRAAFINETCVGDDSLRREVEALLAADGEAGGLIEAPAYQFAAPLIAESDSRSLIGETIGHYQVQSLVGKGGMGEVYRARDTKLQRTVALKVLPEVSGDDERMGRFKREARAASALNHTNVAHIYEIGEASTDAGDISFIAMEYVEGETLGSRINGHPLETREIVEIGIQIADALDEAHSKGITHRDIKPANVMLASRGQVKVLDFGLAKIAGPTENPKAGGASTPAKTDPGVVMGTVPYMSPEQALGREVDHRSDLFSLGVVLYEMATGKMPFVGPNTSETLDRILHAQPEAIRRLTDSVPVDLERIIGKCLEKERERRYQSAGELLADLHKLQRDNHAGQKLRLPLMSRSLLAIGALVVLAATALVYVFYFHRTAATRPAEIRSLAVLPLANLSGDPAQEYFADGMTEALISSLAQIRALRVVSRTSVMRFKDSRKPLMEIAQELGVDAVLEGSVQRANGRVKISAQLIQAVTDAHLWSREYDREAADILKLQGDVARAVADEVRIQLTAGERRRLAAARSVNPAAYEQYLLGRHYQLKSNEEDSSLAIEHLERAIQVEPKYAAAYASLSAAWRVRGLFGGNFRRVEEPARTAALTALALDNDLPEAHLALGFLKFYYEWDWSGAEEEIKRALALDPNNVDANQGYATLLMALGRLPEAIANMEIAAQRDPLSPSVQSSYGRVLYRARKYDEAIKHVNRALELDPADNRAYARLGDAYVEMGKYEEAIAALKKARSLQPNNESNKARLAQMYARAGRRHDALRIIRELKATAPPDRFPKIPAAAVYAALGDKDQAFRLLMNAVDEHTEFIAFAKVEPPFDALHSDPRWNELLRRMKLPID